MPLDGLVPDESRIYAWIEEVFSHGVRRPGYAADRWAEEWLPEQFRALGLERVRAEPVEAPYWEPRSASLTVTGADGAHVNVPCMALPLTAPGEFDLELALFDEGAPETVRRKAALHELDLLRIPNGFFRDHMASGHHDPDGDFDTSTHVLPFSRAMQDVMEPAMHAGAAAFIGVLRDYPGDSFEYYVPYDGVERAIPGLWISGSSGARLRSMLDAGAVRARLEIDALRGRVTTYNIVGELPGADDEIVVIGSHHDGPWASAVEDASGVSLVMAQVAYWTQVPREQRPHRLVFLLNAAHMAGGAGQRTFVETHRAELERCVLHVHLEHAANEVAEVTGSLQATGRPETRWWFTSQLPRLEATVREVLAAEDLRRSLILKPDTFGEKPTTDGADFHLAGVPLVHYLVAPFYLFDAMDTLDKIHRPTLVPLTRAAIRLVESTAGVSAAELRAG